jgi:tetratricopeptide (TPR) repeat protein
MFYRYPQKLIYIVLVFLFTLPLISSSKEAKRAYSQRQYAKAIKLFKEHSTKNPNDGESYLYLGYIYEYQKRYESSIEMFKRASESKLSSDQKKVCFLKLALYYNYIERWNDSLYYTNRYLSLNPSNRDIAKIRERAIAQGASGNGTSTSASNGKKSSETKKKVSAKTKIENSKKSPKDKSKKKTPSESTKVETDRIERLLSLIEKNPYNEKYKWDLVLLYLEEEMYTQADELLVSLLDLSPQDKRYLYKAGVVKLRMGEYEKSLQYLLKCLKLADEADKTMLYYLYLHIGHAYNKLYILDSARESYLKAYQIKSSFVPLTALMKLDFDAEKYTDVIATANIILNSSPDDLDAIMYRGVSYLRIDSKQNGYTNLIKFGKLIKKTYSTEEFVPERYYIGLIDLGTFYANRRKYHLALEYLSWIGTDVSVDRFFFTKGKSLFYLKRYKEAIPLLKKVEKVSAASYLLSKIYAYQEDLEETKEYLLKAGNTDKKYWMKSKTDLFFAILLRDKDFKNFVENQGTEKSEITSIETKDESGINKDKPKDESGINKDKPKDESGINKDKPKDESGINKDKPKDESGINKDKPKDESGINKDKPKDESGINKDKPKDESGINKDKPKDESGINKDKPKDDNI